MKTDDVSLTRYALKRVCSRALDGFAMEHPLGHQGSLAARYLLRTGDVGVVELMFEKGPRTPANLWICKRFVEDVLETDIPHRFSPAVGLFSTQGKAGKPQYGRHSALKPMPQMGHADLVCFALRSEQDLWRILSKFT